MLAVREGFTSLSRALDIAPCHFLKCLSRRLRVSLLGEKLLLTALFYQLKLLSFFVR